MQELIKITEQNGKQAVSAKELYDFLGFDKSQWSRWYKKNITENEFAMEGVDYQTFDIMSSSNNGSMTKDFALSIDFAKKISMLARTEKGEQARNYFIECEKKLKSTFQMPTTLLEAGRLWLAELEAHEETKKQLEMAKPKAEYFDALVERNLLTNFRNTAKELKIGQKEFIEWLLDNKFVYREANGKLMPYMSQVNNGLFELKDYKSRNSSKAGVQPLITPKGKQTFLLLTEHLKKD